MKTLATKFETITEELIKLGSFFSSKDMVPAGSGNFSYRVDLDTIAITVSGTDKGKLKAEDIMLIDMEGRSMQPAKKPSAETLLHTQLYRWSEDQSIKVICHVHSVASVALSKHYAEAGCLVLHDYELLKAFSGISDHLHSEIVPIFANTQNIAELAGEVDKYLRHKNSAIHGYLIAGHGLYSWGRDSQEVLRHIEAYEALFKSYILYSQLGATL